MCQPANPKAPHSILTLTLIFCLLPSVLAQNISATRPTSGDKAALSDENFATVARQIRDLKDPSFRAFLRARIIGVTTSADTAERRQAALSVATEAFSDLSTNQDEISQAQASWLYQQVTAAVKNFDPVEAESLTHKFVLKKDDTFSNASLDLSAAIGMMSNPSKASMAGKKAEAAILTGEVPATSIMGHLGRLQSGNTPGMAPLLSATLTVEDQKPGFIPLTMIPFFATSFLANSTPADIQARFIALVVSRTRLSSEEMSSSIVRSQVANALQVIAEPTKKLAPALYSEVATRLNALAPAANAMRAERQAAEDRIKTSADPLEQMQTEAARTSDSNYRGSLLARAAGLALNQEQLRKAVDLAVTAYGDLPSNATYLDRFLASVIAAALKKEEPDVIAYAASKMVNPLARAKGLIALAKYWAGLKQPEKTAAALHEAARALNDAESSDEKLRAAISLAKGFVEYDRTTAFSAFRQIVDTINKLPVPEKQKEKIYYLPFPTVDELINSFGLLAVHDQAGAFAIAQDIKPAELRLASVTGVYSRSPAVTK